MVRSEEDGGEQQVEDEPAQDDVVKLEEVKKCVEKLAEAVKPVGQEEHRNNLLSFVNWAVEKNASDESESNNEAKKARTEMEEDKEPKTVPEVRVPDWIANPEADLVVEFSSRSERDLETLDLSSCRWLKCREELRWFHLL